MHKKHGFGLVGILLIVVVIGVVGFAGWYVWSRNKTIDNTPQQNRDNDATTEENDEFNKNDLDIPEGWVEFKNNELGIKFIHPDNWLVDDPFGNVTYGAKKILHTPEVNKDKADYEKCEIRGCDYAYYLELSEWDNINIESARGGSSLGMKTSYLNLKDYLSDEAAIKKMTNELSVNGIDVFEVKISDVSEYYGILFQKGEKVIELGFPNVYASEGPDQVIKTLIDSISVL